MWYFCYDDDNQINVFSIAFYFLFCQRDKSGPVVVILNSLSASLIVL